MDYQQRQQSYFYNMRKFHNWIKREMYNSYANKIENLLELAVGKMGDGPKWLDNEIKHVTGYDIDAVSIEEGMRRLKSKNMRGQYSYPAEFQKNVSLNVLDLSKTALDGKNDMDVVSAMFCFHYFFENKESFETVMKSIENNIKKGGIFMGCFFDGKSVMNKLNDKFVDSSKFNIVDKGYIINIDTLIKKEKANLFNKRKKEQDIEKRNLYAYAFNNLESMVKTGVPNDDRTVGEDERNFLQKKSDDIKLFGHKIGVLLKDTVLDKETDEYIVNFERFTDIMKERGFELVKSRMFGELYEPKFNLNNVEKECSFLNRTFVFRKL
jgi:SAM-dependent methyltransferase